MVLQRQRGGDHYTKHGLHMCPLKLLPLNYHYLLPRWWSLGVQWAGVSSRVADLTRRADGASSDLCHGLG